jgi:hypothetical protein
MIHEFAAVIEQESARVVAEGRLPKRDLRLGSIGMAGATNELVIEWLTLDARPTIADLGNELLQLFVSVLEGAERAHEYVDKTRA